jgi:hypothetical protein
LAFYAPEFNEVQKKYITHERELISFIKTYKEYKNILLREFYSIIVLTDHSYNNFLVLKQALQTMLYSYARFY